MRVVDVVQRSPEWLHWRTKGISASDVPIIMGASDWATPWRLWGEKTGKLIPRDVSKNPYVARGVRLEDTVRAWYENQFPDCGPLLPICAESNENPIFRASFDGIDGDTCPVEMKVPSESKLADVIANREQSAAYRMYRYQVLYQMLVADNAPHGRLVFYDAGPAGNHQVFKIVRDDALMDDIRQKVLVFWAHVRDNDEPPKDKALDLFVPAPEQMADWAHHAREIAYIDEQQEQLETRQAELKAQRAAHQQAVVAMMDDYLLAESMGLKVTRYAVKGGVDYGGVLKAFAPSVTSDDLDAYRKPSREQVRITVQSEGKSQRVATAEELAAIGSPEEESFYL